MNETQKESSIPLVISIVAFVFSILVGLLVLAAGARAADFSKPLLQLNGQIIPKDAKDTSGMTLGEISVFALLSTYPDEQHLSGQEKLRRFMLAQKIYAAKGNLDLTANETTMVKTLIAKAYGPLIVGESWKMLDPASVK